MATEAEFEDAVKRVNGLSKAPSTNDLLALYALYKQATAGDVTGSRPGMLDVKGRAKFDAWTQKKGLTREAARDEYLAMAKRLGA